MRRSFSATAAEGTNPILESRFAHEGPILNLVFSTDGQTLVFNIHIGDTGRPIVFPDSEHELPSEEARALFRISSVLPAPVREAARNLGIPVGENARGLLTTPIFRR